MCKCIKTPPAYNFVEFKDAFNDWLRADGQKIWSDKAISAAVRAKGLEKKKALVDGGVGQCFFGIVVESANLENDISTFPHFHISTFPHFHPPLENLLLL